jgi:hypothetical protein
VGEFTSALGRCTIYVIDLAISLAYPSGQWGGGEYYAVLGPKSTPGKNSDILPFHHCSMVNTYLERQSVSRKLSTTWREKNDGDASV